MNFMKKLYIILTPHNDKYSPYVDEFVQSLISEGELIGHDKYRAQIKWRGNHYAVWIENFPYADLSDVKYRSNNKFCHLYRDLRPSRATQIAFWKWMEKKGVYPGGCPSDPQEKNVKALLTGIKDTGEDK